MDRSRVKILFALLAVLFFATPVALRLVGKEAGAFENRRLAEAPSLSDGWNVFDKTTRFLTDRMPLRREAVRANTRISRDLFDTNPRYGQAGDDRGLPFAGGGQAPQRAAPGRGAEASQVVRGRGGWLFLGEERRRSCTPDYPRELAFERWRELVSRVRASGRRSVLVVPPDKYTIYPENLPTDAATARCAKLGQDAFWRLLDQAPRSAGLVGLREPLLRLKRSQRERVYLKTDTHWTNRGGLELVRGALGELSPRVRVAPSDVVSQGRPTGPGDLNGLLGDSTTERREVLAIKRRRGAPRVPGRTLFVLDSFGNAMLHLLPPYFEQFETAFWTATPRAELAAKIKRADNVIFESVEREFGFRASDKGPVTEDLLRRLPGR